MIRDQDLCRSCDLHYEYSLMPTGSLAEFWRRRWVSLIFLVLGTLAAVVGLAIGEGTLWLPGIAVALIAAVRMYRGRTRA